MILVPNETESVSMGRQPGWQGGDVTREQTTRRRPVEARQPIEPEAAHRIVDPFRLCDWNIGIAQDRPLAWGNAFLLSP